MKLVQISLAVMAVLAVVSCGSPIRAELEKQQVKQIKRDAAAGNISNSRKNSSTTFDELDAETKK